MEMTDIFAGSDEGTCWKSDCPSCGPQTSITTRFRKSIQSTSAVIDNITHKTKARSSKLGLLRLCLTGVSFGTKSKQRQ